MSIRDQALNTPQNLETALASAMKACQAAQAALDASMMALVVAVSLLERPAEGEERQGCFHPNAIEVSAMGVNSVLVCGDCGLTLD